jgi:hypothetical protein
MGRRSTAPRHGRPQIRLRRTVPTRASRESIDEQAGAAPRVRRWFPYQEPRS